MGRGRPPKSEIREKITALIDQLKFSYGYEIYKHYKSLFSAATSRVIYYHLKKGVETGEFVAVNVKRVIGKFSWGDESERVYYTLGPFAQTKQEWWKKTLNIDSKQRDIDYDWSKEIIKKIIELKEDVKKARGREKQKLINKCDKLLSWSKAKIKNADKIESEINSIKLFLK